MAEGRAPVPGSAPIERVMRFFPTGQNTNPVVFLANTAAELATAFAALKEEVKAQSLNTKYTVEIVAMDITDFEALPEHAGF